MPFITPDILCTGCRGSGIVAGLSDYLLDKCQECAGSGIISEKRFVPEQKPGKSVQAVGTPKIFIDAVEKKFGKISIDLAATVQNTKADTFFSPADNSLEQDWTKYSGIRWLNPPYAKIGVWAEKCLKTFLEEKTIANKTLLLIPASTGSNYFKDFIFMKSRIYFLSPRITFENHSAPYPKDLLLCAYGEEPGFECWRFKD